MAKVKEKKPFIIRGSKSLFMKYTFANKAITVYLRQGKEFTGKIRFWDNYAIKLILPDEKITIPIHNILYYKCEHFLLDAGEEYLDEAWRGEVKESRQEIFQLNKYKYRKNLLHFYLEDGVEIKGRIQWYLAHMYCIKSNDDNLSYFINKRHILYYKRIKE